MPVWVEDMLWILEAITFPVVILLLSVGGVWLFYKQIKELLGVIIDRLGQSPITLPDGTRVHAPKQKEASINRETEQLEQQLERQNAANRERWLTQTLMQSLEQLRFERIYRVIYGSQMKVLKVLNESPGLTREALAQYPSLAVIVSGTTFDQWLQFLVDTGLVEAQEQSFVITEVGRRFLGYVVEQRYAELGQYPQT